MTRQRRHIRRSKRGRRFVAGRRKVISVLAGHKVTPIKAVDKFNSRFAYKVQGFKGLWTLEAVDINRKKFIYRRYH